MIGAGPNGLVAANVLADHGWSVAVFEAQPEPGGAVRSGELVEPGFVSDLFSSFYPLAAASPVVRDLRLEDHGLRWRRAPVALAHPTSDGTCPVVSMDIDVTAASLDAACPGDGDAWRRLYGMWEDVGGSVIAALTTPFPPVRAGLRLLTAMTPRELLAFARFAVLPVRRLGEEWFRHDAGRRLLAGNALHADFAPESAISGFFGWLLCSLAQQVGFPVPEGGAGNFTTALVRRLERRGGRLTCGARVERVVVRGGRAVAVRLADGTEVDAGRAVVADVGALTLYRDLVGVEHLPSSMVQDLDRFQYDQATVKVDWSLDAPIPWEAEGARLAGTVHVGEGVDALTMAEAQISTGLVPERPFLLVGQYSMTDPGRVPAGREVAWSYTHVPQEVRGDAGGDLTGKWDDGDAERLADRMEAEIERLAPGFRNLVRHRHVLTPGMLEAWDANLVGGAINGGTAQLHQQLVFRPTPGLGRPNTPVAGLYLGSASTHPGGGVHGACGNNAARAALVTERVRGLARLGRPPRGRG